MSKNKTRVTNTEKNSSPLCSFLHAIGGFLLGTGKVLGIIGLVCCVITMIVIPIATAGQNHATASNTYTVVEFRVEDNVAVVENADGLCEVALIGIILDSEADFSKYIGTEVYLEIDYQTGSTREDGIPQRHLIVSDTEHVMQLDMMVDGVAEYTGLKVSSPWYTMYRDCDFFGVYPEE